MKCKIKFEIIKILTLELELSTAEKSEKKVDEKPESIAISDPPSK